MFSMLPPTPMHHNHNLYQFSPVVSSPLSSSPLRSSPTPSPLSPRDLNAQTYNFQQHDKSLMMSPSTPSAKAKANPPTKIFSTTRVPIVNLPSPPPSHGKERESVFSKRASKPNPLFHGRRDGRPEDGRDARRKLFLKRVRDGAEEKRWKERGGDEEIMRVLWIGEERERKRREELAMQAGIVEETVPDEEEPDFDAMMAEEVAKNEEAELEAMFQDVLPQAHQETNWNNEDQSSLSHRMDQYQETTFGSDDDEYDDIFMDVAKAEVGQSSQQLHEPSYLQLDEDQEMMDLS